MKFIHARNCEGTVLPLLHRCFSRFYCEDYNRFRYFTESVCCFSEFSLSHCCFSFPPFRTPCSSRRQRHKCCWWHAAHVALKYPLIPTNCHQRLAGLGSMYRSYYTACFSRAGVKWIIPTQTHIQTMGQYTLDRAGAVLF